MERQTQTIIIVDDEPHIVRVAELKLARAGWHVVACHDGQGAWESLQRHAPALVITDYQMPQMDGLELARKMARDPRFASVPVILLTARGFALCEADLETTNIVKILSKPFSPRGLVALVRQELEKAVAEAVT